jgi:hypothetical protein
MRTRITVFCGSSTGNDPAYVETATALGTEMARRGIGLVYGGAQIGLMGAVADACLAAGGEVTGVIPGFLGSKEIAHPGLTELHRVDSMHERKLMMHSLSNGAIALPGGFGTFEELFELLTWAQLGLHSQPIGLLNIKGYYDALQQLVEGAVGQGFIRAPHAALLRVHTSIPELMDSMRVPAEPQEPVLLDGERT